MTNNEQSHRVIRLEISTLLMLLAFELLVPFPHSTAQQKHRQLKRDEAQQASHASERRVALVIGNSAYKVGPLKNPVNDARAMSKALGELGFDVSRKEDLSQPEMKAAIREFGAKLRRGGVGLFYYAGHGVEVRGENYLIPVDAAPESVEEIEYEAVDAGFVLAQMESAGNGMNIMILDACRDNPFARSLRSMSKGLAKMSAPVGTIIAYATAPGSVAIDGGSTGNGVYTKELLTLMRTPGLAIEEVFKRVRIAVSRRTRGKQIPWESTSLMGDFYFRKRLSGSGVLTADTGDDETDHWEDIKESLKREDFEVYLLEHPSGRYSDLARERIQSLTSNAPSRLASPNAGTTPTPVPTTSGVIRFDGVYRSIKGEAISWLRFYKGGKGHLPGDVAVKAVTQVNAPEEIVRWLDRDNFSASRYEGYQGNFRREPNSNKFYIDYWLPPSLTDSLRVKSLQETTSDYMKNWKRVEGNLVDDTRILLAGQNELYEFVKVESQPTGSDLSRRVGEGLLAERELIGFKISLTGAGSLQQLVPKVAERLRSLGAEVEVDFEVNRRKYRFVGYKNGQKDAAKRIATLIRDLVHVELVQQAQSESMKASKFYIVLSN